MEGVKESFPDFDAHPGLATTAQLREAGWSDAAIRHLGATKGRRVMPGVYAGHRGRLTAEDRLLAAVLWAGPKAVLTGGIALRRAGVPLKRNPSVTRFLVPANARARTSGPYRTVRTTRPAVHTDLGGVPVAGVSRALADAARYLELRPSDLRATTLAVLQRGLVTLDELDAEIVTSRRNALADVREGIGDFRAGAWSLPEAVLIERCRRRADLAHIVPNPLLLVPRTGETIGRPDGFFEPECVAVQVHSRAHHDGWDSRGRDQWQRTVEHDNAYARAGIPVVAITPTTIQRDPKRALAMISDVLAANRGRPRPSVQVVIGRDTASALDPACRW